MRSLFVPLVLLASVPSEAFVGPRSLTRGRSLSMAMDQPPPAEAPRDLPVIQKQQGGAPAPVRYSDFLQLVNRDRIEKVTFSADGTQLLGVDVDGVRLGIESLPNDPGLLTELTKHKVCGALP